MKTVFSDLNQIAHLWANKVQDEAKTSSRNFYFTGDTIYSYGSHFPIAEHHKTKENIVFFTTRGYSVTTTKHIYTVRRAANHKTLIYCTNPSGNIAYNDMFWANIKGFYNNAMQYLENAEKPRIREKTRLDLKYKAVTELTAIETFISAFDLTIDTLKNKSVWGKDSQLLNSAYKAIVEAVKNKGQILSGESTALTNHLKVTEKAQKEKDKREAAQKAERLAKVQLLLKAWLNGKYIDTYELRDLPQIYLRAIPKNDATEIQTSWGARVSLKEGKILYMRLKAGKDINGLEIGGYSIVENTADHIKVGCHIILKTEVTRFAKKMKW